MKHTYRWLIVFLAFLFLPFNISAQTPLDTITVNQYGLFDETRSIDLKTQRLLQNLNTAYARTKERPQIALVVLQKVPDIGLEQAATALYRSIGLGTKEQNNGVLVLMTMDRFVRIEVGYGLEGAIPDGVAGRIIREAVGYTINDKAQSILKALNARIVDEYNLQDVSLRNIRDEVNASFHWHHVLILFAIFLFLFILLIRSGGCRGALLWILLDSMFNGRHGGYRGGGYGSGGYGGFGSGGSSGGGGASGRW